MRILKRMAFALVLATMLSQLAFAQMPLWFGGEPIDFPNGGAVALIGQARSGYARICLQADNNTKAAQSTVFSGGAITSGWLHFQMYLSGTSPSEGLGSSSPIAALLVGSDGSNESKLALWTYNGSAYTELASESGTSLSGAANNQIDMHVVSYGASATVTVYLCAQ